MRRAPVTVLVLASSPTAPVCVCIFICTLVCILACTKLHEAGLIRLAGQVLGTQRKEPGILTGGLLEGFLEAAAWNSAYERGIRIVPELGCRKRCLPDHRAGASDAQGSQR